MSKILIVIVSYNACRYMQDCINSIRSKVTPGSYQIIVVDNASTDCIAEWLAAQSDITLIRNDVNVGFGPACNQAVASTIGTKFADYDIFLLNNDTVVTSTALPRMINALNSAPDVGAVGAMSNYAGNRQQLDVSFDTTEDYIRFGEDLNIPPADSVLEKVRLNGFAMLVKRTVWDKIGGFDEDFAPGYYEDDALSVEIQKLGYRLLLVRDAFIYHAGSVSFVKTGTNKLSYEHHDLFIKKYGFDILNYVYPSGAVLSQIPFSRNDSFKALYIGCGLGAEIKAITSLFKNAIVYGIETEQVLFDIASKTERVFSCVENLTKEISSAFFDLLILDSNYLDKLTDGEKETVKILCTDNATEITCLHEYDSFPYDNIRLILWDSKVYDSKTADFLASFCVMSSTYSGSLDTSRIKSYGINPENILVISPESVFRANLLFTMPSLLTAAPTIVPYITAYYGRLKATDIAHTCANRLAVFEHKLKIQKNYSSKEDFLTDSNIIITINKNCYEKAADIVSFLEKYNFDPSGKAYDIPRISRLATNDWNNCCYIAARDKYYDYGIVGFYCFNEREQKKICSYFAWDVADMEIEKYLIDKKSIPWLSEDTEHSITTDKARKSRINILLKGPDSLTPIAEYLLGGNITTEYDSEKELPSKLFSSEYHIIIYSLLQEDYSSWTADGDAMLSRIFSTLDNIDEKAPGAPMIILLLGSTVPYLSGTENDRNLAELYSELNPIFQSYAEDHAKIRTIDVTSFIKDQSDFNDSQNCFSVRVYSDIVETICIYINEKVDAILSQRY